MKEKTHSYVTGTARINSANPIVYRNGILFLSITFYPETGEIVGAEIDSVLGITSRFLEDIMVGRSIYSDREAIMAEIRERYSGDSKIMLTIAVKDAYNKVKPQQTEK